MIRGKRDARESTRLFPDSEQRWDARSSLHVIVSLYFRSRNRRPTELD